MRALAAAIVFFVASGCAVPARREPARAQFSVLTYNVNYAAPRPDLAARAILDAEADVVCLQETTPQWEAVLRRDVGAEYPHTYFRHEPAAGGIALLSKWPLSEPAAYRAAAGWFPACVATVRTPAGPVRVVGVHLRPPVSDRGSFASGYFTTPPVRRREIEELHAELSGADAGHDLPHIFLGDFNEGHGGGAVGYLRRRGYRDAVRRYAPYASTWRWQYGPVTLRGQLDHILYSRSLECVDAGVVKKGASDHYPVHAAFRVRTPEATPSSNGMARLARGGAAG